MVQSDEYYKSRGVGVTSEVGLTTDRRPFRAVSLSASAFPCGSETRRLYTSAIPDVMWHEPQFITEYDVKKTDGEASVPKHWGIWSTISLPLLQGPLWLWVIVAVSLIYGLKRTIVVGMPLNCIWWWGSSAAAWRWIVVQIHSQYSQNPVLLGVIAPWFGGNQSVTFSC